MMPAAVFRRACPWKVVALDLYSLMTLAILWVVCILRMGLAILTYFDALDRGSDEMVWTALVSVVGVIGFVVWLVLRPRHDQTVSYPGYYGPAPMVPPPSPPHVPVDYPMPPAGAGEAQALHPPPAQYRPPPGYPAPGQYPPPWQPAPQPYPAPYYPVPPPYYPPPGSIPPVAQPPQALRPAKNPFAIRRMIATFFAAMAFTILIEMPIIFMIIAQTVPDLTDTEAVMAAFLTPEMVLFSVAVQDAILVFFLYLAMIKPGHLTFKGMGLSGDHKLPAAIIVGTAIGLAMLALSTCIGILLDSTGLFGTQESPFQATGGLGLVLIIIATVAIAPPAEELFFRGYALTVLEKKWGAAAGVLLSAVLFALAHQSVYQFIAIVPVGIILGLMYRKWGIMPCMTAHAVNNLVAVVLMFLAGS